MLTCHGICTFVCTDTHTHRYIYIYVCMYVCINAIDVDVIKGINVTMPIRAHTFLYVNYIHYIYVFVPARHRSVRHGAGRGREETHVREPNHHGGG